MSDSQFWTFEMVQERLIEALLCMRRLPDREAGWQRVRANWPDVVMHSFFGDYGDTDPDARPRPLPLTRRALAEMEEAGEWLMIVKPEDRRLVALAISCLARGDARVPWMQLRGAMGVRFGADGLRKRYGRAINAICNRLNGAEIRGVEVGKV